MRPCWSTSTSLPLNGLSTAWARASEHACGAKLHLVPDAGRPTYAAVSTCRVPDITAAHAMPVVPGATSVLDLGYYDHAWWAKLDAADCRIVTRPKANTPLAVSKTQPVPAGGSLLPDCTGTLPARKGKGRPNPMTKPVREVRVRIDTGPVLRILTNDLDAPAQEIADLCKRRWAIEVFFRWVKQTLQITRPFGTSENAVRIQVACALTSFLLLGLAQASQTAITSPLAFARLVRDNLMHLRRLADLAKPPQTHTMLSCRIRPSAGASYGLRASAAQPPGGCVAQLRLYPARPGTMRVLGDVTLPRAL